MGISPSPAMWGILGGDDETMLLRMVDLNVYYDLCLCRPRYRWTKEVMNTRDI
jgi:hypothetical protein